jgi:hypothetical protein
LSIVVDGIHSERIPVLSFLCRLFQDTVSEFVSANDQRHQVRTVQLSAELFRIRSELADHAQRRQP